MSTQPQQQSTTSVPDIQQTTKEINDSITLLQQSEQDLIKELTNNGNLTPSQQQKMIEKISQLTDIRSRLFKSLSEMNQFYQGALTGSTGLLSQQSEAIGIVESELNRAKERLEYLETEKNNKIRLVEINQYYGEKYAEHTNLMKIIIFTLIPIILLTILYNKGILPGRVYYIVFILIGVIGAYYFWKEYASIITRDNMNYNEYNWSFDPSSAPKGTGSDIDPWATGGMIGTCIGEACCQEDQIYDEELNQCVSHIGGGSGSSGSGPKESFVTLTPAI
jgi:hypothetical protein